MNYLIKMALRNIWRNKRRSALAISSVGLAALLCVFLQGFLGAFMNSVVTNYTKNDTGDIRITTANYASRADFRPVDANLTDPAAIEAKILADRQIAGRISVMTERITFGVLLANSGLNKLATAIAGDPPVEKELLGLAQSITPGGAYITGPHETIIGAGLAKNLNLKVGGELKVVTTASDGSLQLAKLRVVGIFDTGVNSLDNSVFQMPLTDAKQLLRTGGGTQQIIIMLKDWRDSDAVAGAIAGLLDNTKIAVTPWTKIGNYYSLITQEATIFDYIYAIVLLLGAFIITSIMMMIVLERRHEVGVLKSMGFSRSETLRLFLWEGIFLGAWGGVIGAAVGLGLDTILGATGINFSAAMKGVNFPMDNILYPTVSIGGALIVFAIGVAVAAFMSFLPSRRAAKMNPVEAIKSI